ncbi:hypothetical protein ACFFTN_16985 [Aminobacter aganoensis]|uniref:Uncharacterized protein n=1 Tax=Aminobacter aganoensis TaxID=83264 RepID=A0A7X0KN13_9HYPH|nr:hypothetical protein [Aminobacter aganoensis]MBB6356700.1 hypothetical protein [Aminobacter aganoensis]
MRTLSQELWNKISAAVAAARLTSPINVIEIAEEIQNRNRHENVAFEDILSCVLDVAKCTGEPLLFEKLASTPEGPEIIKLSRTTGHFV